MYVYKWIEQPKQVQPRASHRHLSPTLLFISFEMLMALAKNSMNNLENVKLDEMELAILSRNICQWKPSRYPDYVETMKRWCIKKQQNLKTRLQ